MNRRNLWALVIAIFLLVAAAVNMFVHNRMIATDKANSTLIISTRSIYEEVQDFRFGVLIALVFLIVALKSENKSNRIFSMLSVALMAGTIAYWFYKSQGAQLYKLTAETFIGATIWDWIIVIAGVFLILWNLLSKSFLSTETFTD